MPGFDGTGPNGSGPMSGRGMGRCQTNAGFGRGRGAGFGGGRGFGFRRGFSCPFAELENNPTKQERIDALKEYKKRLETEIDDLEKKSE